MKNPHKNLFTHSPSHLFTLKKTVKNFFPYSLNLLFPKKNAFTLAEVLITIGIIGVVAAITIPTLLKGVAERSNSEAEANAVQKITKSMDLMRADGGLDRTYASTDEFVDELSKYLKITTRCNASNIENCWPTKTVTTSNGDTFEVKNAKTGKNLQINSNTTDNVGMILADGTCIIMTYNTNADLIGDGDTVHPQFVDLPIGFGRTKKYAYTTSVTNPIAFVMDVNGFRGPNSEERNGKKMDIRSFRGAKFAKGCGGQDINGIGCVEVLGAATAIDTTQDDYKKYDTTCAGSSNSYCTNNYWAGAKLMCEEKGMTLPDKDTLNAIDNSGASGLPTSVAFWSSSQYNEGSAYFVVLGIGYVGTSSKNSNYQVLCVGE